MGKILANKEKLSPNRHSLIPNTSSSFWDSHGQICDNTRQGQTTENLGWAPTLTWVWVGCVQKCENLQQNWALDHDQNDEDHGSCIETSLVSDPNEEQPMNPQRTTRLQRHPLRPNLYLFWARACSLLPQVDSRHVCHKSHLKKVNLTHHFIWNQVSVLFSQHPFQNSAISSHLHFAPGSFDWKPARPKTFVAVLDRHVWLVGTVNSPNPSADFFEAIQTNLWRPCGLQAWKITSRTLWCVFFQKKNVLQWRPQVFQAVRIFRFESTLPDLPEFQVATCPEIPVVSVVQVKVAKPQGSTPLVNQVQPDPTQLSWCFLRVRCFCPCNPLGCSCNC